MPALAADLAGLGRFAAALGSASWFAALGQELTEGEQREGEDYLKALGLTATLATVSDWRAAEHVTRDPAWSAAWWDAEEATRHNLFSQARETWGEHGLLNALTRVTDEATRLTLGAASIAAARDGIADPALTRVAAGAATQAAYQAALALAAEAGPAHPFAIKFRLFSAGRWPLGLVGATFHLF